MKKKLHTLALIVATTGFISSAHAYKFVIFTDEANPTTSNKVADLMKQTYPFNKFDIQVEVVQVSSAELKCQSSNGIDRLVSCDGADGMQSKAFRRGGDQAMIVKDMAKWGGSSAIGGGVPTITTGTNPRAMLHEYLHTLGLCDEYEYEKSEAAIYCGRDVTTPNMTYIAPLDTYGGDPAARSKHSGAIPWYKDITSTTPITNNNGLKLGTGDVNFGNKASPNTSAVGGVLEEPTGLYKGKVCNKAVPKKVSWHPGGSATIMENTDAGLGAPLEKIVERLMESKGARKKMQIDEPSERPARGAIIPAGDVVVIPTPEVDNSGRGMFKSFLDWVKDLFMGFGNAISR